MFKRHGNHHCAHIQHISSEPQVFKEMFCLRSVHGSKFEEDRQWEGKQGFLF